MHLYPWVNIVLWQNPPPCPASSYRLKLDYMTHVVQSSVGWRVGWKWGWCGRRRWTSHQWWPCCSKRPRWWDEICCICFFKRSAIRTIHKSIINITYITWTYISCLEENNWNPVEWDRAAEELTWERVSNLVTIIELSEFYDTTNFPYILLLNAYPALHLVCLHFAIDAPILFKNWYWYTCLFQMLGLDGSLLFLVRLEGWNVPQVVSYKLLGSFVNVPILCIFVGTCFLGRIFEYVFHLSFW